MTAPRSPPTTHPAARRLACAPLLLLLLAACGAEQAPELRVVLVTVDTLRYDSLAGPDSAMPQVSALAEGGLVFEQFYAATSSTQPSHASMFTGLHPWQHGVTRNGMVLGESALTVAERLKEAGFATGAVVASFPLERRFGFTQGFDVYVDEFSVEQSTKDTWNDELVRDNRFYSLADEVVDRALALLDDLPGSRQFLWVHVFDPHAPYGDCGEQVLELRDVLSAARRGALDEVLPQARALYDADVSAMDAALARLLRRLSADAGVETHVLFTADHGESFGEDGLLGHGKQLSRAQLHVPTFVLSPRVAAGRRRDVAGSVDVLPTLLSLAGLPATGAGHGRDLTAPPAPGAAAFGMRRTYPGSATDLRADGTLEELTGERFFLAREGLLFLGDGQQVVCADGSAPEAVLEQARRLFLRFADELRHGGTTAELQDDETSAALEALGYVR